MLTLAGLVPSAGLADGFIRSLRLCRLGTDTLTAHLIPCQQEERHILPTQSFSTIKVERLRIPLCVGQSFRTEILRISYGESDADWANDVYAYSESGASYCGTFYLPVSLYTSEDGNGLYAVYEHMDTQVINKIKFNGSEITEEEISDENFPSGNYVQTLMATDYSLLY